MLLCEMAHAISDDPIEHRESDTIRSLDCNIDPATTGTIPSAIHQHWPRTGTPSPALPVGQRHNATQRAPPPVQLTQHIDELTGTPDRSAAEHRLCLVCVSLRSA